MEQEKFKNIGGDLEQLARQLDRALSHLDNTERRLDTSQITPGETAFRDPQKVYHQITLGAVLENHQLSAHHARPLDGLLSMKFEQLVELVRYVAGQNDNEEDDSDEETVGEALLQLLHGAPPTLEDLGRYAEWRRAFDRYMKPTERYLSQMTAGDLEELAERPPTKAQINLIRTTCAYHRIDFPALFNRKVAFEWLRDIGANPRYRERRL